MNYKLTKAGDLMHLREYKEDDATYGLISIKFKDVYTNASDAERLLLAFMQQLQHTFTIQYTTGLHVETFLQPNKTAVTNYWQDAEKRDWKVKGWTNGTAIVVLYIKNIGAVAVAKEDVFLNGPFFA